MRQDLLLRRILPVLLILGPLVVALDRADAADDTVLFPLAAAALVPLAWLIGEATEQAARYTGPGVGGFLNASFGNAPELIIALIALSDGLTDVVRASLTGSVVGNLLLVIGFVLLIGRPSPIDRNSAFVSLGTVSLATVVLFIAAAPGFHGDPDRHSLAVLSLPLAIGLLAVRIAVNTRLLRRQRRTQAAAATAVPADSWSFRRALIVLGVATVLTAFVTETLVGSLQAFAEQVHLSDFFVAIVIVAIVGNITEHGSAVLLARRGQVRLATEIGLASASQVAAFLIPVVAILSWTIDPLALSLRPIELAGIGAAGLLASVALLPGRTSRVAGAVLLGTYGVLVVAFYLAGDR
jgi:Ca2+:H+ antiporter